MNTTKYMEEEKAIRKGIEALFKELGPIDAIRFMNIPKRKRLESVKRHRQWQRSLLKDRFFAEVFADEKD